MARSKRINPNTKYYPPRLMKKLEYIRDYPFTLIEAPSGFGKTTLLEYFFEEQIPQSVPKYMYDFESDEPLFLWRQICQRIQKIDPDCGARLLKGGPPDQDNLSEIWETLRGLKCPDECYLWLDNYKRWNNDFSGEFLHYLAHHGGRNLHVVVSSQPLPPEKHRTADLSVGCWKMGDEDLVFRQEDIAAYFTAAGIPLDREQIQQVFRLTEGWIMALCLQMLCFLECGEFRQGSMTELMEHVFWNRLSPEEQNFLLRLSIYPKFNLSQAVELSGLGREETERMLRDKRYFIHFDSESRCFYPHSQMRILLQERFACLPQETQRDIYLQGGKVAERGKDRLNTLRFYFAAGEWERILSLPLSSYELADILTDDIRSMVTEILEKTPKAIKIHYPRSILSMAFCLFVMGETGKLMELREEITEIIDHCEIDPEEKNALQGELELLLSFLEYNRISDMSRRHRRALNLLKGPAKLISPKSLWTFGSPSVLYLYWREVGKLDEELKEMDDCMPVYYQLTHGHGYGAERIMRAEAHLLRGETEEALSLCYETLFAAGQRNQDSICQCGLFLLACIDFQTGKRVEMQEALQSMRKISEDHREDLGRYTVDLAASFLAILKGKPEEVTPWIASGDISDRRLVAMVQPAAYIIYGRCLLLKKEYYKLIGASQHFLELSQVFPNLLPQVYANLYCAVALDATGKREEALKRLQTAVELAMPDRMYLPFAELYQNIRCLLPGTMIGIEDRQRIEDLAPAFVVAEEQESFTPREQEIHALLKDNLTNKEIAQRMGLSPNTIRNSVSAMLKKRGFKARVQLQELEE